MVEISQVKDYILKNKSNFEKEKINIQLENNNVSKEMINKAWEEIENSQNIISNKFDDDFLKEKKKIPISDMISWVVIIAAVVFLYFYLF